MPVRQSPRYGCPRPRNQGWAQSIDVDRQMNGAFHRLQGLEPRPPTSTVRRGGEQVTCEPRADPRIRFDALMFFHAERSDADLQQIGRPAPSARATAQAWEWRSPSRSSRRSACASICTIVNRSRGRPGGLHPCSNDCREDPMLPSEDEWESRVLEPRSEPPAHVRELLHQGPTIGCP